MPRKALTLEALVRERRFDRGNHRHRRALDESGPLADPELEAARRDAVEPRGVGGAKVRASQALEEFAKLVEGLET